MTFSRPGWYDELFYYATLLRIPVLDVSNLVSCRVIPPVDAIKISDWSNLAQWSSLLASKIPTFIFTNDPEVPWQLAIREHGDITATGFLTDAQVLLESANNFCKDCPTRTPSVVTIATVTCGHRVLNCTASAALTHQILLFDEDCRQREVAGVSGLVSSRLCVILLPPNNIQYLPAQSSSHFFKPTSALWCFPLQGLVEE